MSAHGRWVLDRCLHHLQLGVPRHGILPVEVKLERYVVLPYAPIFGTSDEFVEHSLVSGTS